MRSFVNCTLRGTGGLVCRGGHRNRVIEGLSLALAALFVLCWPNPTAAQGTRCDGWNTTPFFDTATVATVRLCLVSGADVMARNEWGDTPLHQAAMHNDDPAVVSVLLESGADVMARTESGGDTPLHDAGHSDDPAVVSVLLEAGADVMARTTVSGATPLHVAAMHSDDPAVITVLVEAGADVIARNERGDTPLHEGAARYSDDPAVIGVLLEVGADVMARNQRGETPLHDAAARYGDDPVVISALLEAGADVAARNQRGETPLHRAALYGKSDAIVALLDAGASATARMESTARVVVGGQEIYGGTPWDVAQAVGENDADFRVSAGYWRLYEAQLRRQGSSSHLVRTTRVVSDRMKACKSTEAVIVTETVFDGLSRRTRQGHGCGGRH